MSAIPLSQLATSPNWQANFMNVLPAVTNHARISFRGLPADRKEECIAEAIAQACVSYQKLAAEGKLGQAFVSSLANFAVKHVRQGRHVGGRKRVKDALAEEAQRRHGFTVRSLPVHVYQERQWRELIAESRKFNPADVASLRLDFTDWFRGWARRDRKIIKALASGEKANVVADRFGLSPARVCQLRGRYKADWAGFQGELAGQAGNIAA